MQGEDVCQEGEFGGFVLGGDMCRERICARRGDWGERGVLEGGIWGGFVWGEDLC